MIPRMTGYSGDAEEFMDRELEAARRAGIDIDEVDWVAQLLKRREETGNTYAEDDDD